MSTFLNSANPSTHRSVDWSVAGWLIAALAMCFVAYISRVHEVTHDVFHELALARQLWTTGSFPVDDVFAYTPTVSPSVHHEWGTGLLLYLATVETGLGVWGITLIKAALCLILWSILYKIARLRGAHPYVFAFASVIVFPFFWVGFATVRAQLFTLVFIAAQLWMQELDWRGRRWWACLWCAMLVVWLNLHAGFIVGLCLMAVHGAERILDILVAKRSFAAVVRGTWHLWTMAAVVTLAVLVNPYGVDYLPYLLHAIFMPRPTIAEWGPLWRTYDPLTTLTAFSLSIGLIGYAVRRSSWKELTGATNSMLGALMALKHIRHGSIYGTLWLAYVPAWISRAPIGVAIVRFIDEHQGATKRASQITIAACLVFACSHQFWRPTVSGHRDYSIVCFPTGAVEYLKAHQFRGNAMVPFHAGAYVSWEAHPHVKVSLDGRYEVAYQPHVYSEHRQFYQAEDGWQTIVERYPSDLVLIHREAKVAPLFEHQNRCDERWECGKQGDGQCDSELERCNASQHVETNGGPLEQPKWRLVYQDDSYQLYARPGIDLPVEDHRGRKLADRARETFSKGE